MNGDKISLSIKKWSEEDRPREKLARRGKEQLSNSELLAILLGAGNRDESAVALSKRILVSVNNNLNELGKLTIQELEKFKGIGKAKAIAIVAAIELGKRRNSENIQDKEVITSSNAVYKLMQPLIGELPHEEFWVLYLNNSNKVLQREQLSKGGITGTLVDVRLVLKTAIQIGAVSIVLCHNHPSGTLIPSAADKSITTKMINACQSLDIKVIDHVILVENDYFSFADSSLI